MKDKSRCKYPVWTPFELNIQLYPSAYEIYADPHSGESLSPQDEVSAPSMAKRFKDTFSRTVPVHFVGAWCVICGSLYVKSVIKCRGYRDTVSSIGVVRGKSLPGTTSPEHVCFFRHALALDERRVKFLPEYASAGVAAEEDAMEGVMPHVKETWFTGTHSDM